MQFAGSSSTGGRRRRRLVVNGDGTGVDMVPIDGDGAEIESQLVASAAAAPWVPVTELRIWIYTSLIAIVLALLTFVTIRPLSLPGGLNRVAEHLLQGSRPRILIVTQTLFLALSTQMALLIGWYRSRCTLDFSGRYRVWPWAIGLFGIATFCTATNLHQVFGEVAGQRQWLTWRGETVAWALPFCLLGLPISLLLDRDMRNARSSLYTLRLAGAIWLATAVMELYRFELQSRSWYEVVRQLLPVFASAILFVGLWLHARIVAYVSPDPPKIEERSAWSLLCGGLRWLARRLFARKGVPAPLEVDEEEVTKPKRRRKKTDDEANSETEEAPAKRKRKAPARKATSRTRTRAKLADPETEEAEETTEEASYEELDSASEEMDSSEETSSSPDDEAEEWNQEPEEAPPARNSAPAPQAQGRFTQIHNRHSQAVPAPHSQRDEDAWQDESEPVASESTQDAESGDENDEDGNLQRDSGLTSDQMKGLSKRQRRELKKQQRDQERARGR